MFAAPKSARWRDWAGGILLLVALSAAIPSTSSAQEQTARIEGVVLDSVSRAPLIAANVYLRDGGQGTFTDRDGAFRLPGLPALQDHLVVSYVGYHRQEIPVSLAEGETRRIEILMDQQPLEMRRVTVTADRRTQAEFRTQKAVTVTDEEEISRRPAGSTADALRETPGVLVQKTTAGHGAPIIRGLIGKDILLLYNGVRLNKPTFRFGGNQYLNTVDAEALSRIEVVRGPGSVLYGSDAIGGMVNLITSPPAFTDGSVAWRPLLRTRYTSADQGRSLHLGIERAGPRIGAKLGVTARTLGNLNPGGTISVQDPTGYDEISGHAIVAFRLSSERTLRIDLLHISQSDVPRYDQYANGRFEQYLYDPQDRFLGMASYVDQQPLPILQTLEWNFSWQREHEGRKLQRTGSTTRQINDDEITTFGTFIQATTLLGGRHVIRWGMEFYADRVRSSRTIVETDTTYETRGSYPDDSTYRSVGLFLSDDIGLGSRTDLALGVRGSRMWVHSPVGAPFGFYEDTFGNVTGNIGVSHRMRDWLNLVASVSRGFRAPNFNDTVVLQASNFGVDAPSPGLQPEISTNYEIGAKMEWDSSDVEAFLYYTRLEDLIDRRPGEYLGLSWLDEDGDGSQDPDEPLINQRRNVGRAHITGIELQGRLTLSSHLLLRGNAFYTFGSSYTAGEPMSRIPPVMGLVGVRWRTNGTSLEAFVRAAGEQTRLSQRDIDDSRIDAGGTPGWSDWNLRGSHDFGPVRIDLTFGNIFDHAYKEHGSGVFNPGRHVVIALAWGGVN